MAGATSGNEVQTLMPADGLFEGNGGELSFQAVALALDQHHAGIVLHSCIHHHGFLAAGQTDG